MMRMCGRRTAEDTWVDLVELDLRLGVGLFIAQESACDCRTLLFSYPRNGDRGEGDGDIGRYTED